MPRLQHSPCSETDGGCSSFEIENVTGVSIWSFQHSNLISVAHRSDWDSASSMGRPVISGSAVRFSVPPVYMSKCPWARHWTHWSDGQTSTSQSSLLVYVCECVWMGQWEANLKALWIKAPYKFSIIHGMACRICWMKNKNHYFGILNTILINASDWHLLSSDWSSCTVMFNGIAYYSATKRKTFITNNYSITL